MSRFRIARFARLFVYEHRSSNYLRYTISLALLYYIAVLLWNQFITSSVTAEPAAPFPQKVAILLGYTSAAFYYPLLRRSKRENYISLPASIPEKYLSVFINTLVVIPATYMILHILPLSLFSGEFTCPHHVTDVQALCNRALIISSLTCIGLPSANKRSLTWGIIVLLVYFLGGPLRRDFGETAHICFNLLVITILQFLIYHKIKNME